MGSFPKIAQYDPPFPFECYTASKIQIILFVKISVVSCGSPKTFPSKLYIVHNILASRFVHWSQC